MSRSKVGKLFLIEFGFRLGGLLSQPAKSFENTTSFHSALFFRKGSTIVMTFPQFFFDTPNLCKIVLPKILQFWQSLLAIYIPHLSCKNSEEFPSTITQTEFEANRTERVPDMTYTGHRVSWRIFQ